MVEVNNQADKKIKSVASAVRNIQRSGRKKHNQKSKWQSPFMDIFTATTELPEDRTIKVMINNYIF